jgi:polysaccharide export outer membrane protein
MNSSTSNPLLAALSAVLRLFRRPRMADLLTLLLMLAIMLGIAAAAIVAMFLTASPAQATPLTSGDRVQLVLENGEGFSGKYQIDQQGKIALPYAGDLALAGLDADQAAQAVTQQLEAKGLFRPGAARTTVQVLWWAPLNIRVSGEVFGPGVVAVNMPASRDRTIERAEEIPGGYVPNRNLSDALKAAGGITTWADLSQVALRRAGQETLHDVRHLLSGAVGFDPALQEGDEVVVARLAQPDSALARPSGITPPGIKVFAGNIVENQNNAAAANALGALPMAYGSRLSQAVVAINCAGGISWSDASRMASLVRTERATGKTLRWTVPVEQLLNDGNDDINPLLQEGDALACYDSEVTGWREVFRTLSEILYPVYLFRNLP